ncbi:hypothetical protein LX32DRAFT_45137 [Colletotrichum zoysiae]|uniref:Uncharacterized protein n=1 Tax=Colletotrichum zoysiae TaxID=1216348 RepID=A0AAD9HDE8_9PEZI|nr:hypothetical protein LX32DRAFT_45137 [Colletotrichum zoysiae]
MNTPPPSRARVLSPLRTLPATLFLLLPRQSSNPGALGSAPPTSVPPFQSTCTRVSWVKLLAFTALPRTFGCGPKSNKSSKPTIGTPPPKSRPTSSLMALSFSELTVSLNNPPPRRTSASSRLLRTRSVALNETNSYLKYKIP